MKGSIEMIGASNLPLLPFMVLGALQVLYKSLLDEQMIVISESRKKVENKTTIKEIDTLGLDVMLRIALDDFLCEERRDECEDEQSEFSLKFK